MTDAIATFRRTAHLLAHTRRLCAGHMPLRIGGTRSSGVSRGRLRFVSASGRECVDCGDMWPSMCLTWPIPGRIGLFAGEPIAFAGDTMPYPQLRGGPTWNSETPGSIHITLARWEVVGGIAMRGNTSHGDRRPAAKMPNRRRLPNPRSPRPARGAQCSLPRICSWSRSQARRNAEGAYGEGQ